MSNVSPRSTGPPSGKECDRADLLGLLTLFFSVTHPAGARIDIQTRQRLLDDLRRYAHVDNAEALVDTAFVVSRGRMPARTRDRLTSLVRHVPEDVLHRLMPEARHGGFGLRAA